MLIKVVSDLHLEFSNVDIHNNENCDVLVLSGDILVADALYRYPEASYITQNPGSTLEKARRFRAFLQRCSDTFANVVYVAGNHEFYNGKWNQTIEVLKSECAKFSNVHFLERDTKTIDDVVFVGCTLWTDMNRGDPVTYYECSRRMNDYYKIVNDAAGYTKLRPAHTHARHQHSLKYIQAQAAKYSDHKVVVVGHHAPSKMSTHPEYTADHVVNGAYISDLSDFILDRPQIKLWTHGHTHHPFDYMIGSTRIVCNPRGYEGYEADTGWDPNKIVEL